MQLNDVLKREFTDAEFLAHQRDLHKARCEKAVAWVKKDINNEDVVGRLKKEAE